MTTESLPRNLAAALFSMALLALPSSFCGAQTVDNHAAPSVRGSMPEPAIPAILKAFDAYEVVAMPAAHGDKDIDDLILSLVRDPRFADSVNDIVVECGNMRFQPVLDRYIAGDSVPFTEVQHAWRDTTVQQMCGASGFYEQLYPLVRSLNKHLPAAKRLRIVAADPPIDWSKIHSYDDLAPFFDRDGNIASVMEAEVLSRHRKALMLFGVFHLLHGGGPGEGDAVTRYERHFPGKTFVISDLGDYDASKQSPEAFDAPGGVWPSLLKTKGGLLGSLRLDSFLQSPISTDQDCNVSEAFPSTAGKTVAAQIDAFLYLGPQRSQLLEALPAGIALDRAYRAEWLRRMKLVGLPGPATLEELDAQIVQDAARPVLARTPAKPVSAETKASIRQACLSKKSAAPGKTN